MENTFNFTKDQYLLAKETWAQTKAHSASDHIIYNILRSKPIDYGFTIKTKNIQGNDPWFEFNKAYFMARWTLQRNPELFKIKFGFDLPTNLVGLITK